MKREIYKASAFKKELQKLDKKEVKKAIVLSEVLGKPKALRKDN